MWRCKELNTVLERAVIIDDSGGLFVLKRDKKGILLQSHAESPVLHAESSCILHAKEFLLYFTWPLIVTLLRVQCDFMDLRAVSFLYEQQAMCALLFISFLW